MLNKKVNDLPAKTKVFLMTLSNGAKVEVSAKNEKEAKNYINKNYGYFIMNIKQVR